MTPRSVTVVVTSFFSRLIYLCESSSCCTLFNGLGQSPPAEYRDDRPEDPDIFRHRALPLVAARPVDKIREPAVSLSDREPQILRLVADGATNRQVADHLFLSRATVKTHAPHIHGKLGVNDRAAAVAADFRRGPLDLENE